MNEATEHRIDVRPLPPRERHPLIFSTWEQLAPGEHLLLVNDHDPVPLYYQFACEHGGTFHWEYLESGPEVFQVRITKGDFANPGFVPTARPKHACRPAPTVPIQFATPVIVDTRPFFARGEHPCQAIDAAMSESIPGQQLVLLVPFEPVPLYGKLTQMGYSYRTSQQADGAWRIDARRES